MPKKVRRKRTKKYTLLEEKNLYKALWRAVKHLNKFFLAENQNFKDTCERIRTVNRPFVFDKYFDFGNATYKIYDPTPYNILDRSVAGILTYHITPKDDFLELYRPLDGTTETQPNEVKAKAQRTKMIHSILQMPDNIVAEAKIHYDKILFNVSGKRLHIYDDKFLTVHHPPEDLALGSSDGLEPNIFGVKELLDPFQAYSRIETPLDQDISNHWESKVLGDEETRWYRSLAIPTDVLMAHIDMWFKSREHMSMPDYKEFFKSKMKKQWTTITYNDYGIASMESMDERDIVVSTSIPSPGRSLLAKGLGERALPLVVELAEKMEIDVTAYERLMSPPLALPSEAENYGLNFQRDGIMYIPPGSSDVKFISPPIKMSDMLPYGANRVAQLSQTYMLDIFDLIEKVNMPTTEVNYRKDQNLTKGTVYVITDEQSNLRPTVQFLNVYLDSKVSQENKWMGSKTQARYVSPLAQSISANYLARVEKVLLSLVNIGKAKQSYEDSEIYLNFGSLVTSVLDKVNLEEILNDEDTQATEQQIRNIRRQTQDDIKTQTALQSALNNVQASKNIEQGGIPQAGGDTPGGSPPQVV